MTRFLQSTFSLVLLLALLVLAILQVWQLNRIEARLAGGAGVAATPAPAAPTTSAASASSTDCRQDAWWKADEAATAQPGNLLVMHPRCKIDDATVVRGGTLRRVWGQDPNGLNVWGNGGNSADVREIYRYISGIMAYPNPDHPERLSPELAVSVTTPDDGLTYLISLRKGVFWHAPLVDDPTGRHKWLMVDHEFTADDYVFVFEHILDPTVAARFAVARGDMSDLVSVEKVDRYTFSLRFSGRRHAHLSSFTQYEPAPSWLYGYDEDGIALDKASFGQAFPKHWYNQKGIGMGPYQFQEWKQGEGITLVRNERFWGEAPTFDRVRLQIIKDKAGWPRALQNQELDFVHLLPAQYRTTVLDAKGGPIFGDPHVKSGLNETLSYFYIGWNRTNPRLSDPKVRRALTMAVDRQALLDNVYYGLGAVISGPLTPAHSCYDRGIAPWPYDPTAAAKLLDEAGWIDGNGDGVREKAVGKDRLELKLTLLLYGTSEEWATIGNQFKEAYRKIGVSLDLLPMEWAAMQQHMKERDFDAYTGSWSMDYEYDPRPLWHSSTAGTPGSINYIGFQDPEVDKMVESFETDFDEAHRLQTCHQLHRYLHEDEPYTLLFSRTTPVLWWDWLNELELFPANPNRDLRYYSFNTARP